MANIAYIRVSPADSSDAMQVEALKDYKIDEWFQDIVSVKNTNRPKLQEMIQHVSQGDTVYVYDFSRLAKTTADLLKIVEELENKNAHIISVKENYDTSTDNGKLMKEMIATIAGFEKDVYLEKQREGIANAKTKGKYKGRVKIVISNFKEYYESYMTRKINKTEIAKQLKVSRPTVDRLIKDYKKSLEEHND